MAPVETKSEIIVDHGLELLGSGELYHAYEQRLLADFLDDFDESTQVKIRQNIAKKTKGIIGLNIDGVVLPWFEQKFGFPYSLRRRRIDLLNHRYESDALRPVKRAIDRAVAKKTLIQVTESDIEGVNPSAPDKHIQRRLKLEDWWRRFAKIEVATLGDDVFVNQELIARVGETVADLYKLLVDLGGDIDDPRFEGLKQMFERSFVSKLDGVKILFGFLRYGHIQGLKEKHRDGGIPGSVRVLTLELTTYLSELHQYIDSVAPKIKPRPHNYRPTADSEYEYAQINAQTEHLRCMWETFAAVAPERRLANQVRNAALSERAVFEVFDVIGYRPRAATPQEDAERMVDFWITDTIPVQVTTGGYGMLTVIDSDKNVLYKTKLADSEANLTDAQKECLKQHEQKEVGAREKWFGNPPIAPMGIIVTIPKEMSAVGSGRLEDQQKYTYNAYTGRPNQCLVDFITAEFETFKRRNR